MREFFSPLAAEYDRLYVMTPWVVGTGLGTLTLIFAYIVNHHAGLQAAAFAKGEASIGDFLLDTLPYFDTLFLHVYARSFLIVITLAVLFVLPRYFPLAFFSVAFCSLTRSLFINMTHVGIYVDMPYVQTFSMFPGALFFSEYVAFSFILALVFWDVRSVRYFFFVCMVILGAEAVLGHHQYTIDVFAAPFVAYGIYSLLRTFFPRIVTLTTEPSRS